MNSITKTIPPIRQVFDLMNLEDYGHTHEEMLECFSETLQYKFYYDGFDKLVEIGDLTIQWRKTAIEHDINYLTAPSKWDFCTQFYCACFELTYESEVEAA